MTDILNDIVAAKRIEVDSLRKNNDIGMLRRICMVPRQFHSMRKALDEASYGIIAEFKRKSPSKGWIKTDADSNVIPADYETNGASALSILTDTTFFGGHEQDIVNARKHTVLPVLRKDFIIDSIQLYQARIIGADAVLLIAAALDVKMCRKLAAEAKELGLETLLEIHCERELDYVNEYIDMIGVNNRNLGSFHTDVENSFRLASILPKNMIKVSESGISNPETIIELSKVGFKGFLIGETFMRTENPGKTLNQFIGRLK